MKSLRLLILCALPVVGGTALAHHSFANFNMDRDISYEATVVDVHWGNPHTHMTVRIPENNGKVGVWDVEGASINIMARQGWKRNTLKRGDHITVVGHPMKDGSRGISLFYVIFPDGKRMYQDIARPRSGAAPVKYQP